MTVSSTTTTFGPLSTNGSTTSFPFSFRLDPYGDEAAKEQIEIIQVLTSTGAETVLTLDSDYTVSLNGDQDASPGGAVVISPALASGYKIYGRRVPALKQETDLESQGAYDAADVEGLADHLLEGIQLVQDNVRGSPYIGIQKGSSFDGKITGKLTAGYVPVINGALDGWALGTPIASGSISSAMQAFAASASSAAALDILSADSRAWYLNASDLDGVADDVQIQAKLNLASAAGGGVVYVLGTFAVAATIVVPSKCSLIGFGWSRTRFQRTGDYGDTIQLGVNTVGNTAQDCEISGIWLRHIRTYSAGVTTTLNNPVTPHDTSALGDAHIRVFDGQDVRIINIVEEYLPFGIVIDGGTNIEIHRPNCKGIWDNAHSALREGIADIWIREGTLGGDLPTNILIAQPYLSGISSESRSVDWGIGSPVTMSEDIGRKVGLQADCFEQIDVVGGYIGGHNSAGVDFGRLIADAAASGFTMTGTYLDGARLAQVRAVNGTASTIGVTFNGVKFYGAQNTLHAVNVGPYSTTPLGLFWTFNGCEFRDSVGSALKLVGAVGFGGSGNNALNCNSRGLGTSDPIYAAIVSIYGSGSGGISTNIAIGFSNVGGGANFETAVSATNYVKWFQYTSGTGKTLSINCTCDDWQGRSDGAIWGGDWLGVLTSAPSYPQANVTYISDGTAGGTVGWGDCGPGPYLWTGTIFHALTGAMTYSAAQLGDKTHAANVNAKFKFKENIDPATGKGYKSAGITDVAVWWNISDGGSITPA